MRLISSDCLLGVRNDHESRCAVHASLPLLLHLLRWRALDFANRIFSRGVAWMNAGGCPPIESRHGGCPKGKRQDHGNTPRNRRRNWPVLTHGGVSMCRSISSFCVATSKTRVFRRVPLFPLSDLLVVSLEHGGLPTVPLDERASDEQWQEDHHWNRRPPTSLRPEIADLFPVFSPPPLIRWNQWAHPATTCWSRCSYCNVFEYEVL